MAIDTDGPPGAPVARSKGSKGSTVDAPTREGIRTVRRILGRALVRRRSKLLFVVVALASALVVVGGAAYLYFESGLFPPPQPLSLARLAPERQPTPQVGGSLAGRWQLAPGSLVGYRVWESPGGPRFHEAVARSPEVSGSLTVVEAAGEATVSDAAVAVRLAALRSLDSRARVPFESRDRFVAERLEIQRYPTAVFVIAGPIPLTRGWDTGEVVRLPVPGNLTVHGVTRAVEASVMGVAREGALSVAGSSDIEMTDFGVSPIRLPFAVVRTAVRLEFLLRYVKI